ncbi:glycosyltransferase family 57 protein [Tortispora caseinolytica NRRL Y-17796]|uniref:Alpha-1,3-glucosyltransferase n=1 Tax=Tortispora caseinolytica NRRL Y-17796 TaxID=767744 RepID=A0A1E4TIH4_9ASCO|nr:glycosyltransferase family 57 protein [Tortispora caseinolytica NRRL Y-17796]
MATFTSHSDPSGSAIKMTTAPVERSSNFMNFLKPFFPSARGATTVMVLLISMAVKFAIGLGPYSGYQIDPMHGDFEAQRHWLEITTHLPINRWYFYDLQWWGLDYPPLTAYHSYILGLVGSFLNPEWFALGTSRALDDPQLKAYMRATVVFSELLVYIPPLLWYLSYKRQHDLHRNVTLGAILLAPPMLLIDHGHFQYNSVMLGFALFAICNFLYRNYLFGSMMFVMSLCYKQMALFYAPVVFAYLLGQCVISFRPLYFDLGRFLGISFITVSTFVCIFAPVVLSDGSSITRISTQFFQALHRIFPFERGLWEGKVASVWCAANAVIKIRERFSHEDLKLLSLIATAVASLPSCVFIFFSPLRVRNRLLVPALASCSLSFFLFSFQVHEKSILLPLMPLLLMLCDVRPDLELGSMIVWFTNLSTFSLWPLMQLDQLQLQFWVTWAMWNFLFIDQRMPLMPRSILLKIPVALSYLGMIATFIAEQVVVPPAKWPDLFVVANVVQTCAGLTVTWVFLHGYMISVMKDDFAIHKSKSK